ncbi:MAG: hypothetical protein QNJ44_19325 [Rhodobacter sp.]|nr:hypothetical protein [Rhodobacter sp.]
MLVNCGGLRPGDRVLLVHEAATHGYYDQAICDAVAAEALDIGLSVVRRGVAFSAKVTAPPPEIAAEMRRADLTVFLARMGDQIRFAGAIGDARAVVSYALDAPMLASPFGTADYRAFVKLKAAIDATLAGAREIRVTCANGTDFGGRVDAVGPAPQDTNTIRFPQLVYTPVPAQGFSGRIAVRGFLVGTGSQYYDPYACRIDGVLTVVFEGTRRTAIEGLPQDVARAEAHYTMVADRYGIDETYIHSWHGGIHPGCSYAAPASENFARWTGSAFGNPRLLHFHTCGAYAPGEICLNVLDPTVRFDGIAVWQRGRFRPDTVPGAAGILDGAPGLRALFDAPAQDCGLGPGGRLSFD